MAVAQYTGWVVTTITSNNPRRNLNRLAAVGVGTVLWVSVLKWLIAGFTLGHALVLAFWISMGSRHYAKTFVDFNRPLKLSTLVGLALLSPGWPVLYWNMRRGK